MSRHLWVVARLALGIALLGVLAGIFALSIPTAAEDTPPKHPPIVVTIDGEVLVGLLFEESMQLDADGTVPSLWYLVGRDLVRGAVEELREQGVIE